MAAAVFIAVQAIDNCAYSYPMSNGLSSHRRLIIKKVMNWASAGSLSPYKRLRIVYGYSVVVMNFIAAQAIENKSPAPSIV